MKIAIIGAGPAGLAAGVVLSNEHKVIIFEASDSVGGLSKSFTLWDRPVDIGPHRFFTTSSRVYYFWETANKGNYHTVERKTRIYYNQKFFDYPLKILNTFNNLSLKEFLKCIISLIVSKFCITRKQDENLESWFIRQFGKRLYEIFFKRYTEKLWGMPCAKLDKTFAKERIKKISPFTVFMNSINISKKNKIPSFISSFVYPDFGNGYPYQNLAKEIISNNGKIYFNAKINKIISNKDSILSIQSDNKSESFDLLISSMPITSFVKSLNDCPTSIHNHAFSLKYRNSIIVYLKIHSKDLFPDQWIYVNSSDVKFGRITNFNNWHDGLRKNNNTVLAFEFWTSKEEDFWNLEDKDILFLLMQDIRKIGFKFDVVDHYVLRIKKTYPVYTLHYQKHLQPIKNYLKKYNNLFCIGRTGTFQYNNQDQSILSGLLVAENIMKNSGKIEI